MEAQPLFNNREERIWMRGRLRYCLTKQPYLAAGFLLYWTWVNLTYQMPWVFRVVKLTGGFMLPTRLVPITVNFVTYAVACLWFWRTGAVIRKRWWLALLAVLLTVGSMVTLVWANMTTNIVGADVVVSSILPNVPEAEFFLLLLVAAVLIGIASACMCIEMQRFFGSLGSQYVLFIGCIAMFFSSAIIAALSCAPVLAQEVFFLCIPAAMVFCLYRTLDDMSKKDFFSHGLDMRLKVPYKFLFTAMLHGLSLGVLLGFSTVGNSYLSSQLQCEIGYALAAVILLCITIFMKLDYNHLIYQVGFPVVAVGAMLIVCLGDPTVGTMVQLTGFCLLHLVMWGVCAHLIKGLNQPPTWVIAISTCAFMFGQLLSGIISSVYIQSADPGSSMIKVSAVVIFLVLFASLFMMSNRNLQTGWGLARIASKNAEASNDDITLDEMTAEFELSEREAAVLMLLERGWSRRAIGAELSVSEETVKSHTQHIYQKLNIHSKQELIELFEDRAKVHRGTL